LGRSGACRPFKPAERAGDASIKGDVIALPPGAAQPISALAHLERLVHPPREHPPRERIFNVPVVVLSLLAVMGLVHALMTLVLSADQSSDFLVLFAFVPGRYDLKLLSQLWWVPGWGAAVWTFLTYAFIHGNLMHLGFNGVWLLAFGTPVARRFGPLRFLIFFLLSAAVGAALHLAVHSGERLPMVGASAAISGAMAAAMRFAFQRGGPLGPLRRDEEAAYRVPAPPLSVMLREPRLIVFLIVWFGVNLLFGLEIVSLPGEGDMPIAWEAHIGGFLAGLVSFALFDPVQADASSEESIEA
jgi:membrane associated rhomboid family serine protease